VPVSWENAHPIGGAEGSLTHDAVHALLVTRSITQTDRMNRAKSMAAMTQAPVPTQRTSISAEMRLRVWQRDGGACRGCGSNVELQLDHVIPVAFGGSNSETNLQMLCASCNHSKGASVL
jgi:5-methylcytosine-specific restriction endonuclease McrA